jgi:nucleotide-binding universal stress UspA family protein
MTGATYLIATDLSGDSRKAAALAGRLAERTGASLEFFCAVPANVVDEYGVDLDRARTSAEALARRETEDAVQATAHVAAVRDVPASIVRRAEQTGAALLVLAPHGVTGWKRVALGSVTERVLRLATGSVLVARSDGVAPPKRILVGLDRGPVAAMTLRNAIALARLLDASLTAVHVVRPAELLMPLVAPAGRALRAADERLAEQARRFREWIAAFPSRGVEVTARVVEGSPAERLVGEAARRRVDLVVVGAGDASRLRRALLGSVSYAVAATCPVSVLVVRRPRRDAVRPAARNARRT